MLEVTAVAVLVTTVLSFAFGWLFEEGDFLRTLKAGSWSEIWRDLSPRNRRACMLAGALTAIAMVVAVVLAVAVLLSDCPGGDC